MKRKRNLLIFILSFVYVYLVAFIGNFFTSKGVRSFWYLTIRPSITPPDWVFLVVWNILFFLIALSLFFLIKNSKDKEQELKVEILFSINFILNIFWTFFYFTLRKPTFAFIDLILLWFSILSLIYISKKIDKKIIWMLIPYLLWVSFAGILNFLSI
jgi:tryptophan-rich sensory protein